MAATTASAALGSTVLRHQLASGVATAIDLAVMTALVESARLSPAVATLIGASVGAVVNFRLNRRYTFPGARTGVASVQAARYALVSAASAALNAFGEHVGTRWLGLPYLAVRAVVSLIVGFGWNYPLQRSFVFGGPSS